MGGSVAAEPGRQEGGNQTRHMKAARDDDYLLEGAKVLSDKNGA